MSKTQFSRLIWLADTIYRNGKITFKEINKIWRAGDKERVDISIRTFHNHRIAIEELFDINIECDRKTHTYYIEDSEILQCNKLKMKILNGIEPDNISCMSLYSEKESPFKIKQSNAHHSQLTILKVSSNLRETLRSEPLDPSQKETEIISSYSLFELQVAHTNNFIQQILSYGSEIEVIIPDGLRDKIKEEIDKISQIYTRKTKCSIYD